ncbi:Pycsar system effector family protein [Kitasatospora indigofera]|uniref:Pycsar system effector family protein n=1 Tax=Kitasatospora indigofera TaxID=67307 RepID=UPI00324F710D
MSNEPSASNDRAVQTAWQIHASLTEVTGRVDAKASFALTIESALLGAVVALSAPGNRLSTISGPLQSTAFWIGITLLSVAALAAVSVVIPRGGGTRSGRHNFIYYGQLRHWAPDQLAEQLTGGDLLPLLSQQLVAMSRIVWTKHRRVQQSLVLAVAGAALLLVAGLPG